MTYRVLSRGRRLCLKTRKYLGNAHLGAETKAVAQFFVLLSEVFPKTSKGVDSFFSGWFVSGGLFDHGFRLLLISRSLIFLSEMREDRKIEQVIDKRLTVLFRSQFFFSRKFHHQYLQKVRQSNPLLPSFTHLQLISRGNSLDGENVDKKISNCCWWGGSPKMLYSGVAWINRNKLVPTA